MKRRLTKLVVFLLLGAIVNVAVAWGCATWIVPLKNDLAAWQRQLNAPLRSDYRRWWATHAPSGFQKEPVVAVRSANVGVTHVSMWKPVAFTPEGTFDHDLVLRIRAGWPLRAVEGASWRAAGTPTAGTPKVTPDALVVLPANGLKILLRPVWPGFAINTLLYAGVLWLLTLGSFTARRIIRRRRGLCIKCGYDLRGTEHAKCPECGWGREGSDEPGI